jgi:O-antigen/teichoic acid export membrane protein
MSKALISLIFPPEFAPAAALLSLLIMTLPISAMQVVAAGALMLTDHQKGMLVISAVTVAFQLGLNLILIPLLGTFGAALALAGSQTLAAALCVVLVRRWLLSSWASLWPMATALSVQVFAATAGLGAWAAGGTLPAAIIAAVAMILGLRLSRLRLFPHQ